MGCAEAHTGGVHCVDVDAVMGVLVTGGADGQLSLYSSSTRTRCSAPMHKGEIYSVCFLKDGARRVASGASDNLIVISSAIDLQKFCVISEHHTDWIRVLQSFPSAEQRHAFVSGSDDGLLCVWESTTGVLRQRIDTARHHKYVRCLSIRSTVAVSCGNSTCVVIFAVTDIVLEIRSVVNLLAATTCVALLSDATAAAACEDTSVIIVNIREGFPTRRLYGGHGRGWDTLCVSLVTLITHAYGTEEYVITSGTDGAVVVWDLKDGSAALQQLYPVRRAAITAFCIKGL